MSTSRRKRQRIPSLSLKSVLKSNKDGSCDANCNTLLELQTALASTDIRNMVKCHRFSEELVLLWTVSKIGFLNTVLLLNCIAKVLEAMLTHRKKFILEEVQRVLDSRLDSPETYIDLMVSYCSSTCQNNLIRINQRYMFFTILHT